MKTVADTLPFNDRDGFYARQVERTVLAQGQRALLLTGLYPVPRSGPVALWWQTENLHAALKTRGFHFEDTGLTQAERVSTLLIAVSLAFAWACLTGEIEAARQSVRRKNHGDNEISVFRLGLETWQDLLQHPSPASCGHLAALVPRF